ncbi:MAG: hypothetical protein JW893_00395 [Candidatus Omnitrophica bacterium]|nr:hypothetical protein [Candidatus Omnitrophota bacterium]
MKFPLPWGEPACPPRFAVEAGRTDRGKGEGKRIFLGIFLLIFLLVFQPLPTYTSEVLPETETEVLVREHPKTGKPYISIVSVYDPEGGNLFKDSLKGGVRPDYRLLDRTTKPGEIPYEGPVSDRTKVYVLAASLATLGAVGSAVVPVAATTGSAAGGAGAYAAAGAAVSAGTVSTAWLKTRPDPEKDDYVLESSTAVVEEGEKTK